MEAPRLLGIQNSVAHSGAISSISVGSRTGLVFATGGIDKMFNFWTVGKTSPVTQYGPLSSFVTASQFAKSEEIIICGTNGGSAIVYDISSEKTLSQWSVNSSCVHGVCFDPSNQENAVMSCHDGRVQILAQKCHAPVQTYIAGQNPIACVAYSNDGRFIACGGEDKCVNVYDIRNSGVFAFHALHNDAVRSIQFHPTESIIASGGADRSIRFFDYNTNQEMGPSLPLNTSEIKAIRFAPKENTAISLSSQLLNIVGYNPTEVYDRFNFSIGVVHDMQIVNGNVVIASAMRDHVIMNRIKLDTLNPFSPYGRRSRGPSRKSDASKFSPIKKDIQRRSSEGYFKETTDETAVFLEFRRDRGSFCTEMNERFSRLDRLGSLIANVGYEKAIEVVSEGGDLQPEMASVSLSKIKSLKIKSASPLIRIAEHLFSSDSEVALSLIDAVLSQFGKLSFATMRTSGVTPELEERKIQCRDMINAYHDVIPEIENISRVKGPLAQTANDILEQWKGLI